MANGKPTTVDEYCRRFNTSFFDLRLHCIFCSHIVPLQEIAGFYVKRLNLIWKGECCYACCAKCLTLSAKFELENYTQCCIDAVKVEDLLNQKIKDVPMRCLVCVKLLDVVEKLDCLYKNELLFLVRGRWRGPCRDCISKQ